MWYWALGIPIEPGFGVIQGNVPRVMVVSVCPKPSMMVRPVFSLSLSNTAGFSASPAVQQYSSDDRSYLLKSSRIMKR